LTGPSPLTSLHFRNERILNALTPISIDLPAPEDISKCVHCGLCLQHCPTYLLTGDENESPRGRLHLIGALNEGRIESNEAYSRHINLCLVCRACENVCPSGVPFGRIMERARAQLVERSTTRGAPQATGFERLLRWLVFRYLLPSPRRLRLLAGLLRHYQRSGAQRLFRASPLPRLLPSRLERAEAQLPRLPDRFFRPRAEVFPAEGPRRHRVGLFNGCVMPYMYPEVHAATMRVLRRNGCEVVVPAEQVCCGAVNVHSGEREIAREMARRNVRVFLGAGVQAVIVNSAGCGSTLKEYGELLAHDRSASQAASELAGPEPDGLEPGGPEPAEGFSLLVKDVNEFLASIELERPARQVRRRVTLQDSCHLVHAQRIKAAPRQLLALVPGLELIEMAHPDLCCGSAGIYNITQPGMSAELLESKMSDIQATWAETIATANPGCLLQLEQGVRQSGMRAEVVHVVQLLDAAYGAVSAPHVER
jgi:glycolate oxidase iron-sulfur subunit